MPAAAATVLLLRDGADGIEVLLQRRGAALRFMGGMWVFPGGRHEDADRGDLVLGRVRQAGATAALRSPAGELLEPGQTLGLYVTACRETFEECGVLLATDAAGDTCFERGLDRALALGRAAVAERPEAFGELLIASDLYLDVSTLVYWSHWITPAIERRRFDTRFFAVGVPPGTVPGATDQESTEQCWLRPAEAIAAMDAGRIAAAPPTVYTLADLVEAEARHGDVERLLRAERGRPVPPIRPVLIDTPEGLELRLPWDPEYPWADDLARPDAYPAHLLGRASRVRLKPEIAANLTGKGPAA
jgi:8-oxo-dGTP pyrophosphatase MutT (NUDIX family)